MKRYSVLVALALVALMVIASAVVAQDKAAPAKGKEVTMTGKLSCTSCVMTHPDKPCPPGCCESCIKAGDAPLFTDKDGNQFILVSNEMKGTLMTPDRVKMMGGMVTVKGMQMSGKGVQVIAVEKMDKAADEAKPAADAKPATGAKPADAKPADKKPADAKPADTMPGMAK